MKTPLENMDGIQLTQLLKKLEETSRDEKAIEIEVEEEIALAHYAKGIISIQTVSFDYTYHGDYLYLDAHDMEAHFDHTRQWDEHQFLLEEKELKERLEPIFPVPLVVNLSQE